MEEKKLRILGCMADVLQQNGYQATLLQAESGEQPPLLRLEHQLGNRVKQDVLVELCFIPVPLAGEDVALLQLYGTLLTGLHAEFFAELRRACEHINPYSALGYFGLYEPAGQLFLRHNTLLHIGGELGPTVTFIADNISLFLAGMGRFLDGFAAVGNGLTLELAIEQKLAPSLEI